MSNTNTKSAMDLLVEENLSQQNAADIKEMKQTLALISRILEKNFDERELLSKEILKLKEKVKDR